MIVLKKNENESVIEYKDDKLYIGWEMQEPERYLTITGWFYRKFGNFDIWECKHRTRKRFAWTNSSKLFMWYWHISREVTEHRQIGYN